MAHGLFRPTSSTASCPLTPRLASPRVHPQPAARSTPATPSRAASRFRRAWNSSRVRGALPTDRSTCWALAEAAEAPLSPRRQPTKREACTFAAISQGCMQRATRREVSLARRERTRTNSGPCLNSASSSATTLPGNSGAAGSHPLSGGKLNRRQSFAAAVRAENSIDDNHRVYGFPRPQALGKTNSLSLPAHPETVSGWAMGELLLKTPAIASILLSEMQATHFGFLISSLLQRT